MANLFARARGRRADAGARGGITTLDDYANAINQFIYNGNSYPLTGANGIANSMTGETAETIRNSFPAYAQAYAANGIIFACMLVRASVFSSIRFQYQQLRTGRPGALFGAQSLSLLENPWSGGTTQDLLARIINDADLAGNSYTIQHTPLPRLGGDNQPELVRLRPDWLDIVLRPRWIPGAGPVGDDGIERAAQAGWQKVGYLYYEGGDRSGSSEPAGFLANEVAHFAPIPDPLASYRGMSWLTPVIREVENDNLMMRHKRKFFENAATSNVIVRMDPNVGVENFLKFKAQMESEHQGIEDAYKTLFVGGAADVTVAGADFQQMDFKTVQGAGETRIAAAAGVHPVIVGLSEGLAGSSLNAGNYAQVRKRFANGTMHPLWQNVSGSFQRISPPPAGSRLWYDARDVPFLHEDEKDAAEIEQIKSTTITGYVREGFTPESAIAACDAEDITLLVHTGKVSVQLQEPGAQPTNDATPPELPASPAADEGKEKQ